MPATAITVDTPLRGNPSAGPMSVSITSPNVQQPAMTTVERPQPPHLVAQQLLGHPSGGPDPGTACGRWRVRAGRDDLQLFCHPLFAPARRSSSRLMAID